MVAMPLTTVSEIYECCEQHTWQLHRVPHPVFKNVFSTVRRFEQTLGAEREEFFWQDLFRELRRYRFALCAAPIPVNSKGGELSSLLQRYLLRSQILYPNFASQLEQLSDQILLLRQCEDNPLLDRVIKIASRAKGSIVAVVKESWLVPYVEEIFKTRIVLDKVRIAVPYQMRSPRCYENLILIGSPSWFVSQGQEYVLSAPRARNLHLVNYKWISDRWSSEPVFIRSTRSATLEVNRQNKAAPESLSSGASDYLETESLPEVDWTIIPTRIPHYKSIETDDEIVEANLYLLAGDATVLLNATNARVHVLDPENPDQDGKDNATITWFPVSELKPGMFILLRSSGGGDYVVPLANRILGKDAPLLRERQRTWKSMLRKFSKSQGIERIVVELKRRGSTRANETNVRNWMSNVTIRPHDDKDFRAILRLVGLEGEIETYQKTAEAIYRAHRQAGYEIRELLLHEARKVEPEDLHKYGKIDFELPDADGGSLTAYRIEDISPEVFSVPESRLGQTFHLGSSLWRE